MNKRYKNIGWCSPFEKANSAALVALKSMETLAKVHTRVSNSNLNIL